MDYSTILSTADAPLLDTIDGAVYYELRVIISRRNGLSTIECLSRDWPILSRDLRIAELTRLLEAEQQHTAEAERHCQELISRNEDLARQLEAAHVVPPAIAAAATGMVEVAPAEHTCVCGKSFKKSRGLNTHRSTCAAAKAETQARARESLQGRPVVVPIDPPAPAPIVFAESPFDVAQDRPWECASCHSDAFARSVADPSRCISCVAHERPTNGHALAAA
jgi:hypothetical protein